MHLHPLFLPVAPEPNYQASTRRSYRQPWSRFSVHNAEYTGLWNSQHTSCYLKLSSKLQRLQLSQGVFHRCFWWNLQSGLQRTAVGKYLSLAQRPDWSCSLQRYLKTLGMLVIVKSALPHYKYAKVIMIHPEARYLYSYNSVVKVITGDLQWHIALGFLPDGVTISARLIVVNTDGGPWKGKQTRQCTACQKGRAPKLLSIGPQDGQKKLILGVELQFTVQSM